MVDFVYIGNDNLLTVTGLQCNAANSVGYVHVASCYVTLVESGTANEVQNQSWPLALALVDSATATWQTTLQDTLTTSENMAIEALITLDAQALGKRYVRFPLKAVYDKG